MNFELIKYKLNSNLSINIDKNRLRPNASEVTNLLCDNKKILEKTEWKPSRDFSYSLDLTINWFKENIDKFDSSKFHV